MLGTGKYLLSGRRAIIIGLVVIAVVLLAMPLREYLGQRTSMRALDEQTQEHRTRVDELQRVLDKWQDPEYVRAQARERLHYVLPGEVGYIVLDVPKQQRSGETFQQLPSQVNRPWYDSLWRSVQGADG